ncbi:MAG: aspartate ammonia-lyase [Deltaproteobacteria bacterium]|jgi:aspartate ammonia-lyase|nr:aspartate ammonia-lyase [Deltaproteobacteria bacterium]
MRLENDIIGPKKIPRDDLYGIHSLRARSNFGFPQNPTVNLRLIRAITLIKKAAAITYEKIIPADAHLYRAIHTACDQVLAGKADDMFIVPAIQGGAGTSTNMNVNEVVANLALKHIGYQPGEYKYIHPLDHVNRGQSTNDVYPTALRIAAIFALRDLSEEAARLQESLQTRENEFKDIKKLGRTELMDAVPVTLGEEFGAYAQGIARDRWRLYKIEERLRQVNIGGAAVGLSSQTDRKYRFGVLERLRELTSIGLAASEYPMDITQNNDVFVEVSGLLKAMSVNFSKIAGDLRLMNSGPEGGLGEIQLEPLQMGSTIMPGKINPVIPEFLILISMKVMANDLAITMAASRGEFELNSFLPLIAESLLESLELSYQGAKIFREKCIDTLKPQVERCFDFLNRSTAFAASFVPILGHGKVSEILKENAQDPARALQILLRLKQDLENQND